MRADLLRGFHPALVSTVIVLASYVLVIGAVRLALLLAGWL